MQIGSIALERDLQERGLCLHGPSDMKSDLFYEIILFYVDLQVIYIYIYL